MHRGRAPDLPATVADLIRTCHEGAAEASAADRQDAVAVALQTDGPACEPMGFVTATDGPLVRTADAPIITPTAPSPFMSSLALIDQLAARAAENEKRHETKCNTHVAEYLAGAIAAYLGVPFYDVWEVFSNIPAEFHWNFSCRTGWGNIVNHVALRLLGDSPAERVAPTMH